MKIILLIALGLLLLSACTPSIARPTKAPLIAVPPADLSPAITGTPEVKVVEMVTQTPLGNPPPPAPTRTPIALFQTFAGAGIPAETYQDAAAGFAFDYPSGWMLTAPVDPQSAVIYSISLRSSAATRPPKQQEGIPEGMTAIDVAVYNQGGPKTLEQAINERRASATHPESGQPLQIALEEDWILSGGLKAHRFLYNLGPDPASSDTRDRMSSELVTIINGKMVLVSGQGSMSLYNLIASSLRESK